MRNCRPRCATAVHITATPNGAAMAVARSRGQETAAGSRHQTATKYEASSSRRPSSVGPRAVMDGRFWLWGARKTGMEHHTSQQIVNSHRKKRDSLNCTLYCMHDANNEK